MVDGHVRQTRRKTVVILCNWPSNSLWMQYLDWSAHLTIWLEIGENGVAQLFDPDLTAATGIILFISSFINILTNFSFFFSSVFLSISHHSLFFSHRVTLLTPPAPVATHPGCHSVCSLYCRQPLIHPPSTHLSPCLPASPPGSSDGGPGFIHSPAVSTAARSFSSPAEGHGAAD